MTSVSAAPKQSNGHFIAISSVQLKAYTGNTGSGANSVAGTFSDLGTFGQVPPNTLLKDLGQTVVSSLRLFRKVAPVTNVNGSSPYSGNTGVTFGVSTSATGSLYVGYVELGYEGTGNADAVARFNSF
jgi:hypothetical protein